MKTPDFIKSLPALRWTGVTVAAVLTMAGCASEPAPAERMILARDAVNNVNSSGGGQDTQLQIDRNKK